RVAAAAAVDEQRPGSALDVDCIAAASGIEGGGREALGTHEIVLVVAVATGDEQVRDGAGQEDHARTGPRDRGVRDYVGSVGSVRRVVDADRIRADARENADQARKRPHDVVRVVAAAAREYHAGDVAVANDRRICPGDRCARGYVGRIGRASLII